MLRAATASGLRSRAPSRPACSDLRAIATSYYARTRSALLELAIARIAELDDPGSAAPGESARFAGYLARFLHTTMTKGRSRLIARYEFALEATRRPELREIYDRSGLRFREMCAALLAAAGSADPPRPAPARPDAHRPVRRRPVRLGGRCGRLPAGPA